MIWSPSPSWIHKWYPSRWSEIVGNAAMIQVWLNFIANGPCNALFTGPSRTGKTRTITSTRQLHTMSKTLKAHRTGLLNWYDEPISTGPLEGINNKIGALQRRAYGYRNYEHLKQRLLTLHHTKFSLIG